MDMVRPYKKSVWDGALVALHLHDQIGELMRALEHNLVGHPGRIRTTSPALSSPGVALNRAVVLLMTRNGLPVVDEEKVRLRFMPFHLAVTESSCSLREVRFRSGGGRS